MQQIHVLSRAVIIDQGFILLCKTKKYEKNFYFMPGGHVEVGESAEEALFRELQEELAGVWHIERFLGCFEYSFIPETPNKCHRHEYNICFLVSSGTFFSNDIVQSQESHIDFEWISTSNLSLLDVRPSPLRCLIPEWLLQDHSAAFAAYVETGI